MTMDNGQLTFKKEDLIERVLDFGVRIIKLVGKLPKTPAGFKVGSQIVGSATSIGANTQEAQDASSKADFISKMSIALREAKESKFWLKLIKKSGLLKAEEVDSELKEADELCAIYSTIVKKTKLNLSNVKSQMSNAAGFTLIELMVAVSIIAILATFGLISYQGASQKARDSIRKKDLNALSTALEIYFQKNNRYIIGSGTCSGDTPVFYNNISSFMSGGSVPKDPVNSPQYCYVGDSDGKTFRLFAKLENLSDADLIKISCSNTNYNYSVVSDNLSVACPPSN